MKVSSGLGSAGQHTRARLYAGAIPGIGQVAYGVTSGLGQLGGPLGATGQGIRDVVRKTGIKGLDAGFGCGVGVGYGFGAGLFLKPSAVEQLLRAVEHAAGQLIQQLQLKLADAGLLQHPAPQQQQAGPAHGAAATAGAAALGPSPTVENAAGTTMQPRGGGGALAAAFQPPPGFGPAVQPHVLQAGFGSNAGFPGQLPAGQSNAPGAGGAAAAATATGLQPLTQFLPPALTGAHNGGLGGLLQAQAQAYGVGGAAGAPAPPGRPHGQQQQLPQAQAVPPEGDVYRTLLLHEQEIARLRRQNRALRHAVCKVNRRLPLCKEISSDGDNGF